jgi:hypothetical protein
MIFVLYTTLLETALKKGRNRKIFPLYSKHFKPAGGREETGGEGGAVTGTTFMAYRNYRGK